MPAKAGMFSPMLLHPLKMNLWRPRLGSVGASEHEASSFAGLLSFGEVRSAILVIRFEIQRLLGILQGCCLV